MAKKEEIEIETEESSSILDDIYDIAHDIFPEATERLIIPAYFEPPVRC